MAKVMTDTQIRLKLEQLRKELSSCYKQEDRPVGRINEIAREIAELQERRYGA